MSGYSFAPVRRSDNHAFGFSSKANLSVDTRTGKVFEDTGRKYVSVGRYAPQSVVDRATGKDKGFSTSKALGGIKGGISLTKDYRSTPKIRTSGQAMRSVGRKAGGAGGVLGLGAEAFDRYYHTPHTFAGDLHTTSKRIDRAVRHPERTLNTSLEVGGHAIEAVLCAPFAALELAGDYLAKPKKHKSRRTHYY